MADNKAIYKMTFKKKLEQVGVPFRLEKDKFILCGMELIAVLASVLIIVCSYLRCIL